MGTRGLVGFVIDGELKATYNHFDSYPEHLGQHTLEFIRERYAQSIDELREQVRKIKLVNEDKKPTKAQAERLKEFYDGAVGTRIGDDGKFDLSLNWYQLLRGAQGELGAYCRAGYMIDSADFAFDSLFCEWGYLVNLDTCELEVYRGFNDQGPARAGRWAGKPALDRTTSGSVYWPIERVAAFPFEALPEQLDKALPRVRAPWADEECYAFDVDRYRPMPGKDGRYAEPQAYLSFKFGQVDLGVKGRNYVHLTAHTRRTTRDDAPIRLRGVGFVLAATLTRGQDGWETNGTWHLRRVAPRSRKGWRRNDDLPTARQDKLIREAVQQAVAEWAATKSEAFWQWCDFVAAHNAAIDEYLHPAQVAVEEAEELRKRADEKMQAAGELEEEFQKALADLVPPSPEPVAA